MLALRPVWGVDVGDAALKAVKLKRVGPQIVLQDFQIIRYSDLSGRAGARREESLAEALAALRAAGLGRDKCIISIAPQAIFSRFISLPPVDKRRVPEIVLYEARQQIPFSLNEVIWAYQTVRKEFIPGEEIEIGLFAVKREVVDAYLAEMSAIGRNLHGIQVAPLGLYNYVRHDIALEKPTVIMDIGAQSTDLLIVDGDRFWLRNLPIAGNSFTSTLEKRLNITREEAEKLKLGIADSRHRRKLLEVLRPVMRDLVGEVQRSIGYYKSLSQDVKFEDILVVGEGYRLFGLDRFLQERLQYNVTPVQQLKNILYQGPPDRMKELGEALPSLSVAMGLALQGLGQAQVTVNLLPDDFVIDRELHKKRFNGLIAAGLVVGIVGCFYLKEARALERAKGVGNDGEQTLIRVKQMFDEYEAAKRPGNPAELEKFREMGRYRMYDAQILDALSRVIPREARIDQFTIVRHDTGAAAARGEEGGRGAMPSGVAGAGASPDDAREAAAVNASELRIQFKAWVDAPKEAVALKDHLPRAIKQATLFPEKVPLVTGVAIGQITTTSSRVIKDGIEQDKPELTATVEVGLLGPRQAFEAQRVKREELAKAELEKKRAEEAARTAKPPEGAEAPTP